MKHPRAPPWAIRRRTILRDSRGRPHGARFRTVLHDSRGRQHDARFCMISPSAIAPSRSLFSMHGNARFCTISPSFRFTCPATNPMHEFARFADIASGLILSFLFISFPLLVLYLRPLWREQYSCLTYSKLINLRENSCAKRSVVSTRQIMAYGQRPMTRFRLFALPPSCFRDDRSK
jgi:hypothetical protein